ncbi:hypothetical protein EZJ43_13520 [Pedobacter changchengzhani]|uniref:Lipoprotein n=1 Tax=Pedobacter changchengzhani TaxID=2529274 RepID=A0A4V6PJ82_9SPHI|nr:hypothetical protein [Pedobacter changchengzhani]TDG35633.1 hypothetical protein EZJ43_13520 [Pedobacter changchengzhani]
MKYLIVLLSFTFALQSCENKTQKTNNITQSKIIATDVANENSYRETNDETAGDENNPQEPQEHYPKTGNKASDFLPILGIYEIQYEAKGDLNKDGKDDIVAVLVHKEVKTAERPMLILLQNKDKSYRLDKVSKIAFPIEYNEFDFKFYDTEDISIENGELYINLYSIGSSGNIFGSFKYIEKDFVLTKIEAFYRGAGGSSGLVYDFSKDELTTTETNTMEENMPSITETIKTKKQQHLFETTSITTFFNKDE